MKSSVHQSPDYLTQKEYVNDFLNNSIRLPADYGSQGHRILEVWSFTVLSE